jgi:hypothetical protein
MVADRLRMSRYVPLYAGKYSGIAPVVIDPSESGEVWILAAPCWLG